MEVHPGVFVSDVATADWRPDLEVGGGAEEHVLFAGDLVEARAAPYMGDAYVEEWSTTTLDQVETLAPQTIVPGRGPAAGPEAIPCWS